MDLKEKYGIDVKEMSAVDLVLLAYAVLGALKTRKNSSYDLIAHFNKQLEDIQHTMETKAMDVFTGYKLAKQTQDVRRMRRILKRDIALYQKMNEWKTDIKEIHDKFERIAKSSWCKPDNIIQQSDYSNDAKLGKLTYGSVEDAYNATLPDLEDGLQQLKKNFS